MDHYAQNQSMSLINNTQTTASFNTGDSSSLHGFYLVTASVLILIIIVTIIGNVLVCVAILVNGQLRSSPTMLFIFSLAVSDLLTASLSMTFDVDQQLSDSKWSHSKGLCEAWTTAYLITVPSSIWNLLVVSVDRYKSLKDPLSRYRQSPFMTRKRAALVIVLVWIYSVVFALIPIMGWKFRPSASVENNGCFFNIAMNYSILSSFINFIFPLLVMCFLYFKIFMIARNINSGKFAQRNGRSSERCSTEPRSSEDAAKIARHTKRSHKRYKRNMKAAKNILIIVCAFFFCWMPHTLLSLVTSFHMEAEVIKQIPAELFTAFLLLGYLNSALNPPLYTFHNKRFKDTYVKCLGLKRKRNQANRHSNLTALSNIDSNHSGSTTRRPLSNYQHIEEPAVDIEENVV
ncbi:5-hydroxytryptamine receptor 1F [Desmophyllum pertusum]|uniref:5-hydroxytryptamine receptor 1F n=1 Tax=Desmophyllum pertusum TaxID=174260 RepID=A0A9W9YNS6_9CNID|nr:5-hydroxytryptamine receptor 1F [Desmophyllum pertusum]